MPLAKIHVLEGQYDEARLARVSSAVQDGLVSTWAFQRTTSFRSFTCCRGANSFILRRSWGSHYSADLILLELTFISGVPGDATGVVEGLERRRVSAAGVSPMISSS